MVDKPITSQERPILKKPKYTRGQKLADFVTKWAGSWTFIGLFFVILILWMLLNSVTILFGVWDKYPFILLNLFLSCLAAVQAPIILMSQNRMAELDRQRAQNDYIVDKRAEREIKQLQVDVLEIKESILKSPTKDRTEQLRKEIKKIQEELESLKK